jgi:hypothetical protein
MQLLCRQFAYSGEDVKSHAELLQIKRLPAETSTQGIFYAVVATAMTHHCGANRLKLIDIGAATGLSTMLAGSACSAGRLHGFVIMATSREPSIQ